MITFFGETSTYFENDLTVFYFFFYSIATEESETETRHTIRNNMESLWMAQ